MPPKKRVAATKLRWAKWREEPAEEEPDDEPEVELEEPEEEPADVDPLALAEFHDARRRRLRLAMSHAFSDCEKI